MHQDSEAKVNRPSLLDDITFIVPLSNPTSQLQLELRLDSGVVGV